MTLLSGLGRRGGDPNRDGGRAGRAEPGPGRPALRRRVGVGAAVALVYVAVAVGVWWHVWTGHPTSEMTCGCGDPALFVWSFGWIAHAIAHGDNPFLSTAIFHPHGMNLLSNATAPLDGFLLAPVTWIFGPVASVNVANTLAPAVSAMATYWAVRRTLGVGRAGALVAGLVVELSPAIVSSAAVSHLQVGMVAFLPVVAVCLHELFVRQQDPPWRWGVTLAAAAVGQFFTGTEMLVIAALFTAVIVILAGANLLVRAARGSAAAAARGRYAARGLAVGAVCSGAALAAPAWYALAGPRSFSGVPWPGASSGVALRWVVTNGSDAHTLDPLIHLAGYPGPIGATVNHLGLACLVGAMAAVVVLRRRPAVWLLAAVAVAAAWLSLGATWQPEGSTQPWWMPFLPWAGLRHLPVVGGVLAQNFALLTVLAVAALVGLLADRMWQAGRGRVRAAGPAAAVAVSGAVLGMLASSWALPLRVQPADIPAWFVHEAPRLPSGSVVLSYPFVGPPGESEEMVWQSVDEMGFAIAGGCCLVPGPTGAAGHGTSPGSATMILGSLSSGLAGPLPSLTDAAALATVRRALGEWRVTTVVVTDRGRDPAYATRWFTALLGRAPALEDGARVWTL